ncbi:MAG TPA: sulfotransferase [Aquihabitans sp.]|jgi:hypothetical protein|nr:sulfotransferase [Aquihabitans sp.]
MVRAEPGTITRVPEPSPPDIVVVGAPRSGTSLACQLLADAGYAFGDRLLPASEDNRRGFFEDQDVTECNDGLLEPHLDGAVPHRHLAWLAALSDDVAVTARPSDEAAMAGLLPPAPACLKDPRFCYTLDAWRPVLRTGTRFLGVVRHPAEVATSLRAMFERQPEYYQPFDVTLAHGFAVWEAMNRRLLGLTGDGPWTVVTHDGLLDGSAAGALAQLTGRPVSAGSVDRSLHRSRTRNTDVPSSALALHEELRRRAAAMPEAVPGG